jgi:hypothetical protein
VKGVPDIDKNGRERVRTESPWLATGPDSEKRSHTLWEAFRSLPGPPGPAFESAGPLGATRPRSVVCSHGNLLSARPASLAVW